MEASEIIYSFNHRRFPRDSHLSWSPYVFLDGYEREKCNQIEV